GEGDDPAIALDRGEDAGDAPVGQLRVDPDPLPPPRLGPALGGRSVVPASRVGPVRIDDHLLRALEAEILEPARHLRAATARVDDEVRSTAVVAAAAVAAPHHDATDAPRRSRIRDEPDDLGPFAQLEVRDPPRELADD